VRRDERRADRAAGVAGSGLDPEAIEPSFAQQLAVGDAVERDAAGEAEVLLAGFFLDSPGQLQHHLFGDRLDGGRESSRLWRLWPDGRFEPLLAGRPFVAQAVTPAGELVILAAVPDALHLAMFPGIYASRPLDRCLILRKGAQRRRDHESKGQSDDSSNQHASSFGHWLSV